MSDSEDTKLQFRVLRRQFLFRVVDVEALSAHALGDANKLLGQFVALLFFISICLSFPLLGLSGEGIGRDASLALSVTMEHLLIATTMLAVGIFAVLSWDSILPDRGDVLVLAPLPVRPRTMFFAKLAATATALAVVVLALNAATGLGWPLAFALLASSGGWFIGIMRCFAAYWLTMLAAGAFIYCGLSSIQAVAAQILPRRVFLRASGILQMAAFCVFVSAYFLEPSIDGLKSLAAPEMQHLLRWMPTYWFFGLFNELAGFGRPILLPLARRACLGTAVTAFAAAALYPVSYMRTMRRTLEQPDITAAPRRFRWLPRFGNQMQTAMAQFTVRSLTRSRYHRLIVAFYFGLGLAFTIVLVDQFLPTLFSTSSPTARDGNLWRGPNVPILAASIMMTVLAVVGVRVGFAIPIEFPANWIFRSIGVRPDPTVLAANRRALLFLSVMPVWLVSAALCLKLWPWRQAVDHLAVLALLAVILADLAMWGFRKIPFACSYLPGKSQAHMVFLAAIALAVVVTEIAISEMRVLGNPTMTTVMLVLIGAVAAGLRWSVAISSRSDWRELQFDETDTSALLDLGISRDGGVIGASRPDRPPN
jgi:hypothetical protein